jgi:NAD(P)H-hydrate epimerase
VIGPGIGVSADTRRVIEWMLREGGKSGRPLLIDADGLNALAALGPELVRAAKGPVVLTPHPGEMARLLKSTTTAVNADRIGAARKLASITGATVLLKGARSVIVDAAGVVSINGSGNPGMATPGMGDVLSGMIGALMGQGMAAAEATVFGAYVHGLAADRLAARIGRVGYLAGDLTNDLPAALTEVANAADPAGDRRSTQNG